MAANFFKKTNLTLITFAYWFLLIFIVAAWIWWFISLTNQNAQMLTYKKASLNKDDIAYLQKLSLITEEHERKTAQFISEGITFLLVSLAGALFVYRATRKQFRLSRQQNNFMMAVTHELKTPVAVTRLNLETLQKYKLDEVKQQKLITHALEETDRLNSLTNNILVAAQFESGNYSINKTEINFSALVQGCIKDFIHHFPKRIIQPNVEENIFIEGETLLLQMLVNNLLDNAQRYSPKEENINIALQNISGKAILKIADKGEGIADNEKKKIFSKFYRVGNESTRKAKGTGLGLYLTGKIIKDHNGKISVEDNDPTGTIVTVTINTV